jgi:hypothetical protein
MNDIPVPASLDRLTELVVQLSGAPGEAARGAVEDAVARNGRWGDNLLNVADALVTVRGDLSDAPEPVPARA